MKNAWFTRWRHQFEAEIEAEFRQGFPLWKLLPESRATKTLAFFTLHDRELEIWKSAMTAKCAAIVSQVRHIHTHGSTKNMARSRLDDALAGHAAVWGKVSAFRYLDYEALRQMARRASSSNDSPDGLFVSVEELERFRNLKAPTWKQTAECIRRVLIERLLYVELRAWDDLTFEKRTEFQGHTLRVNFGRPRAEFGFNYNVSLLPLDGHAFQVSYERTIGIGVGAWDRVATDNLDTVAHALAAVLTRLETILNNANSPIGGKRYPAL